MEFNQETYDLICKLLFIAIPIMLITLTNLPIWQIILIMIVMAIFLGMIKKRRPLYERFAPQCPDCINPYVITQLAQVHDPTRIAQRDLKPTGVSVQPIATVPLSPQQLIELKKVTERESTAPPQPPQPVAIQQPEQVKVKPVTPVPTEKIPVCEALHKAGFDPNWTYEVVSALLQTPEGQRRLNQINSDVLRTSQISSLTNQDIVHCYPHYITEYVCKKSNGSLSELHMSQLKKKIEQQQQQINTLSHLMSKQTSPGSPPGSPPLTTPPATTATPVGDANRTATIRQLTDVTDIRLENQIMNTTTPPQANDAVSPPSPNNPNCKINEFSDEIRLEVEKFYGAAYQTISQQRPTLSAAQLQQIKNQYLNLADITQRKAILEFQQLITLYQNRTREQWGNDLISRKTFSVRGHLVPGTDFYIPWTIFDKHSNCFGSS